MTTEGSLSCAVIGLDNFWGLELASRLAGHEAVSRVLGVGLYRPSGLDPRIDFQFLDLTDPGAADLLAEWLSRQGIDVLAHLAFRESPSTQHDYDHAFDVGGSERVFEACELAGVGRLVVASTTMVYGALPSNPNYLSESRELRGHPGAHCVQDRIQVEELATDWLSRHPEATLTILRSAWPVGPRYRKYLHHFFGGRWVPTCLGYDPLLQMIHEEDLLGFYEEATLHPHPGIFNAVGKGTWPLSRLLAAAGKRGLPLPPTLLDRASALSPAADWGDEPSGFYDYLRYLWVADGSRAWSELGEPEYSTWEAWLAFTASNRKARRA